MKALQKGLDQLCEEGATQLFRPLRNNDLILGAIGPLQFDVVAFRLADEYGVNCAFEPVNVVTARWVAGGDEAKLAQFRERAHENLALDHCRRARLSRAVARQPGAHARALARPRVPRDARAPGGGRVKRAWLAPAGGRLGPLRLGQLGVRDDRDGGLLPGLLQAVLERGHGGRRQHLPARPRRTASASLVIALARAAARRDRRPRRRARAPARVLHGARRRDDRGAVLRRRRATGSAAAVVYSLAASASRAAIIFNDSLLVDVAEPAEYDRVSAFGYSLGYLGGGLLFALNVAMVAKPARFGLADAAEAVRLVVPDGRRSGGCCSRCRCLLLGPRGDAGAAAGRRRRRVARAGASFAATLARSAQLPRR